MEVYRTRDQRWVVERAVDRYLVYDLTVSPHDEVYSCATLSQLYDWLDEHGIRLSDLLDSVPGAGSGDAWEPDGR